MFGVAIGIGLGLQSIYLTECSPKECRGIVSMMTGTIVQVCQRLLAESLKQNGCFFQFGVAIGSITAMPIVFGTNDRWHYIYVIELCILLVVLVTLPFMNESPG